MRKNTTVKRTLALTMAVLMGASLAGCGSKSEGASSKVKEDGTIDTSSHEVINMLVLGNKPSNGRCEEMLKELNKVLTDKVNAELELTYVEWADWQTQYNTQLLSGDASLDIITTATDWLYGWENAQKGAFLPLTDDMLKTYAPKTYEQVEADGNWDICKLDGEIMFIPEDNYTQYTNHGMMYRGDWAKEAGIPDGTITKFDEMTTYFKWVKENKPDVVPWDAGKNNLGSLLEPYILSNTNYRPLVGCNAGNYEFWFTSKEDPYIVSSPYMEDDTIYEAAELMKEWNEIGVWPVSYTHLRQSLASPSRNTLPQNVSRRQRNCWRMKVSPWSPLQSRRDTTITSILLKCLRKIQESPPANTGRICRNGQIMTIFLPGTKKSTKIKKYLHVHIVIHTL